MIDDPTTGRPVEKLLQGQGRRHWGAVAMTFVNDRGGRFTALRTYYVPRRATRSGDVQMQLATHEGSLSLETLEVAVPDHFHANTLKKIFPGIRVHRTYAEYSAVLHAPSASVPTATARRRCGCLPVSGPATRVRSVDELYKEMVLERPSTYAAADRAIEHFDDLDAAHTAMRTEEQKLELLEPITALHERKVAARRRQAELDSYGVTLTGDTPLRLWLLQTHLRLLEAAVAANRDARSSTGAELAAVTSAEVARHRDLEDAKEAHRASGGSTLQALGLSMEQEQVVREDRLGRRATLQERLLPLIDTLSPTVEEALGSAADFARFREQARQWLAGREADHGRLKQERDAALRRGYPLQQRQSELRSERASLEGRASRVPAPLHEMRAEVAAAGGLGVGELPFVAELIDVAPEEARWRTAIETVLGGTARVMLVPLDRLDDFSAAIDGLQLRGRLTFEGVQLDLPDPGPADPESIAGKLSFKDSAFSGWVQGHVSDAARNALCVETAAGLTGPGLRVTLAGQTRSGRRGAHGRGSQRNIIGFSNEDALAEIDEELSAITEQLGAVDGRVAELDRQLRVSDRQRAAYDAVAAARFDDIDVDGSDRRLAELERRRGEILGSDDKLRVLQQQIEQLAVDSEEAREQRFGPEQRQRELNNAHGELVDSEDLVKDRLEAMRATGEVVLTAEQDAALSVELAAAVAPADPDELDRFNDNSQRLGERLRTAVADAEAEIKRAEEDLAGIFRLYKFQWDSPNPGETVDSYPDYARILEEIRGKGLADRRSEWRRRLTEWSGRDLVPLVGAMAASIEDIEDRLEPINAILRRLKFGGAAGDRLRIRLRRLAPAHVQVYMKDLRALSAGATSELAEADPGPALHRPEPFHDPAPQARAGGRRHERTRPAPRRTTTCRDQRRALRPPHRRAASDLPNPR
ncbi:ATP-binding protein [Nocardioides sp. B-3]|uniref:ATP-binding protein n=1 Tax=Nocardioides sp. B-3 TaxID=2895565 RepID=UPI002153159C|nr:hypothetical protein [Nocardioides sp. B-3]UUZ58671.1 hypothetical protein LP418_21515 [Nocardioides sp. B-3]